MSCLRTPHPTRSLVVATALVATVSPTLAQSARPGEPGDSSFDFELPTDQRLWLNSPPLTMESLSGKGVIFYFFEEEDPRIAANWPNLLGLSSQYEGKPLLFVGVNSGSDPTTLKRYVSRARIRWPVIVDYDRTLESSMGVRTLAPDGEVFAVKYVDGSGSLQSGNGADFAGAAEAALRGASWRVDPGEIPPKLMGAWRSIELGDFASPASVIARAASARDDQIKAGAEKLLSAVEGELTAAAEQAQAALDEGNEWLAYRRLDSLSQRFGGYEFELLELAEIKSRELAKTDAIKKQIAAGKLFDKAVATGSRGTSGAVNRAKGLLKRIVEDYPETDAATKAQDLLASIGR